MFFYCCDVVFDGAKVRRFSYIHNPLCVAFAYRMNGIYIGIASKSGVLLAIPMQMLSGGGGQFLSKRSLMVV